MTYAEDRTAASAGIRVPAWIEADITLGQIIDIAAHGCDAGGYMPAVTYVVAEKTMAAHGDAVVDFLYEHGISSHTLRRIADNDFSWGKVCVEILATAVDVWAHNVLDAAREAVDSAGGDL